MAGTELGSAYISVGLGTNKLGPEIKKLFGGIDADAGSSGSQSGEKFAGGFGGSAKAGIGIAAAGLGAALVAGLFSAVEGADAGAKLSAQLGLDPAESERAGGVAGSLYAGAYGDSLSGVNDAVGSVMSSMGGMRDASTADLEDITAKALNLAGAFDVDVSEATTAAGILMKSGLAGDADAAMDQITSAMQRVPAGVRGEILPVMSEYSKHFAALGIDGDTAMGMIVAGADNGAIGMDKVGDAVKEFTIRATDMSKSTTGAYEALGLNSEEMTNKLLAGGDSAEGAMGQIIHGLQGVTDPADQAALSLALFGTPMEDLGTDQIPNFLGLMDPMGDAFDSTAGAADSMGDTLNSGPGVALEELKRTVETTFMSLAETALPALKAFTGWLTENQWVIGVFAALVGVALVGAFIAWAASVWVATIALLANPITWIVLAIVALIAGLVLLVMNWDAVVAFLTQVWGGFVNWLIQIMDGFVVWWNQIWGGLGNWIKEVWDGFISWISDVWNGFMGWIQGVLNGFVGFWNDMWGNVGKFISDVWNNIVNWVTGAVNGVWRTIMGVLNTIKAYWDFAWTWVLAKVNEVWEGIKSGVSNGINSVVNFVGGLKDKVLGGLSAAGSWLFEVGRNIIQGMIDGVSGMIGRAVQSVKDVGGSMLSGIQDFLGIKSPSRVFKAQVGMMIGAGLIQGINASERGVTAAVNSLVSVPTIPNYSAGSYDPAGAVGSGRGNTFNTTINQVDDPIGTSHAVVRRQVQLGV